MLEWDYCEVLLMGRGKFLMYLLGLAAILLVFLKAGPAGIYSALKGADLLFLLGSTLLFQGGKILRGYKWMLLFGAIGERVGFSRSFLFHYGSRFAANLSPGRFGEPATALLLRKYAGVNLGRSVSVLLADKALELFSLLLVMLSGFLVVLPRFGPAWAPIVKASAAAFVVMCVTIGLLLFRPKYLEIVSHWLLRVVAGIAPKRAGFLEREASHFFAGLHLLSKSNNLLVSGLALTLVAWIFDGLYFYSILAAFGSGVSFIFAILVSSTSLLVGTVSMIPSGIGIADVSLVTLLSFLNVPIEAGAAIALTSRMISMGLTNVIGWLSIVRLGKGG